MLKQAGLPLTLSALALLVASCSPNPPTPRDAAVTTSTSDATTTSSTTSATTSPPPVSTTTTAAPAPTTTTTAPQELAWDSPSSVTSGVPVYVASVSPCPPPPKAGDSLQVVVWVGESGPDSWADQPAPFDANSDGSWSRDVTFLFNGPEGAASIGAECEDFTNVTSFPYAYYQTRDVQVSSTSPPTTTTAPTTSTSGVGPTKS